LSDPAEPAPVPVDPLERFRHEGDSGPGVLAHLDALERALQSRGFPAMSTWWRECLTAFYSGRITWHQLVVRVGRRGGKSSTLSRIGVLEALFGDHVKSEGDLNVVAIVSVSRPEAMRRLRLIRAILRALGIEPKSIEQGAGLELEGRGVAFIVFAASIAGVSGFSCICAICDEVSKWKDLDTGVNPATEVLASLRPTLAGQANARIFLSSSATGTKDAHAIAFDLGDTDFQMVAGAVTWVARPSLTEAECRAFEPDEEVFWREYGCIPFDGSTAAIFTTPILKSIARPGPLLLPPAPGTAYYAAQDPANRGGNGWTLVIAFQHVIGDGLTKVTVAYHWQWRAKKGVPLDSDATLGEIAKVLEQHGIRELWSDQWSFDALAALALRHGIELRLDAATQASNVEDYDAVRRRAIDKTLELPDDPVVRSDLLGVSKWIGKGGAFSIELEKSGGRHCDFAPAVKLAVKRAAEGGVVAPWIGPEPAIPASEMRELWAPI
jgi:hypothetical protein